MRAQKKNILVVVAHPDDEVIGCGGTIATHHAEGNDVHLIVMADGVTSREYDPENPLPREKELESMRDEIDRRHKETLRAAQILGIPEDRIYRQNLADQRLDQYPLLSLIKTIENVKERVQPSLVYTHFWGDLNLDHQLTCRAVLTAFRPKAGQPMVPIYHFEVPESTGLNLPGKSNEFNPNHFVNITATLAVKRDALKEYVSEQRDYPDPRSIEFLAEWAEKRAHDQNYKYAEAFIRRENSA